MLIIKHRCNTIEELKDVPPIYGVEIDIRTRSSEIILHHDPFKDGVSLQRWLKYYKHKFLILNIKEEGIEKRVLEMMQENAISQFFLLDQSFPFLIKTVNSGESRCAVRVSEYESLSTALSIQDRVRWIWLDMFTHFPLSKIECRILNNADCQVCLVSPELHGHPESKVKQIIQAVINSNVKFDAVCTKNVSLWENYLNQSKECL